MKIIVAKNEIGSWLVLRTSDPLTLKIWLSEAKDKYQEIIVATVDQEWIKEWVDINAIKEKI